MIKQAAGDKKLNVALLKELLHQSDIKSAMNDIDVGQGQRTELFQLFWRIFHKRNV